MSITASAPITPYPGGSAMLSATGANAYLWSAGATGYPLPVSLVSGVYAVCVQVGTMWQWSAYCWNRASR